MVSYLLLILALVGPPQARTTLTEEELIDAIRHGKDIPLQVGDKRPTTVSASRPVPRRTADAGTFVARISDDSRSITLVQLTDVLHRIEAADISRAIFSGDGAWPDHKSYNDSLYTWNRGSDLDFGEVVATKQAAWVSFHITARFHSSYYQGVYGCGLFKLDRFGLVGGSLQAWEFDSLFAIQGHGPSAPVLCRLFVEVSGQFVAIMKTTPDGYRVQNLASGKTLKSGLSYRLLATVGSDVLLQVANDLPNSRQIFRLDLKTLSVEPLGKPEPWLEVAAIRDFGAVFLDSDFDHPHVYLAREKVLVPLQTK